MELKFKHFVALNALDVLTTWYALTYLGLHEGNSILSPIFQQIGLISGLVLIKLIGLMVLWGMLSIQPLNIKKFALNIICLMFIAVVLNNSYQMIRVI
jgi:hypothetical protein